MCQQLHKKKGEKEQIQFSYFKNFIKTKKCTLLIKPLNYPHYIQFFSVRNKNPFPVHVAAEGDKNSSPLDLICIWASPCFCL